MKVKQWEVYIIQTNSGKLYTGITTDLDRRFNDHLNNPQGAKFFHFSSPEKIVFRESHPDRSSATKREIEIKKLSRSQKLELPNSLPQPA
ncbi:MAG: GIY-YIG nuclease family protein [Parachlamydiaceae bacterium]|nr:GIY-YIG nuclease family protein [Parachlamydiaceae bacterium]